MITAAQLDVLFEFPRAFSDEDAAAFNAAASNLTAERAANDLPDVEAFRPWLASLGIVGPEPRIGLLARRLAGAYRRISARAQG